MSAETKKSLIKYEEKDSKDIDRLVFVGNGAINGGWDLLKNLMEEHIKKETDPEWFEKYYIPNPIPETLLANLVMRNHWDKINFILALQQPDQKETIENILNKFELLLIFKNKIGRCFNQASTNGELAFNTDSFIESNVSFKNDYFITTNWDCLTWNAVEKPANIIQLHGICFWEDTLIFPSEYSIMDLQFYELGKAVTCNKCQNIIELFQPREEYKDLIQTDKNLAILNKIFRQPRCDGDRDWSKELMNAFFTAQRWIKLAKEVVFWGIAANPYDAELIALISSCGAEKNKKVTIINPNEDHRHVIASLINLGHDNRIDYNPVRKEVIKYNKPS